MNTSKNGKNANDKLFNGLVNLFLISKSTEISLTSNLWTKRGLVKDAQGTVKEIIYPANKTYNSFMIVLKV